MQLPREFIDRINIKVSRHKHPERLDWIKRRGKWEAAEGDRKFVLIYDDHFGHVIAENKAAVYSVEG